MHTGQWSSTGILLTTSLHLQNQVAFSVRSEALIQILVQFCSAHFFHHHWVPKSSLPLFSVHRPKTDTAVFLTVHRFKADTVSSLHPWTQPLSSWGPTDCGPNVKSSDSDEQPKCIHLHEFDSYLWSVEPMGETMYCSPKTWNFW